MHWSRAGRIALLPPLSVYNSTMKLVEQLLYGKKIAETELPAPPIFVLGFWRSGTTLLHNLMASDPQFTYVSLYQSVFPWHFLTTHGVVSKLTAPLLPKSRPMDNVAVGWDVAQEDEVALCIMTLLSPYLLVAFAHDREIYRPSLDIDSLTESQRNEWRNALELLVKKVTLKTPKQIVLKSPSHTFRVKELLDMYPGAKFVYIYREPFATFNSNCHLRKTLTTENNFDKAPTGGFEEDVIDCYNEAFVSYQTQKKLIPEGDLHEIAFEDLAADPLGKMVEIYDRLSIPNVDGMREAIEPQVEKLKGYKKNKFVKDPHWEQVVYERCRAAYDEFGYPAPVPSEELTGAA